MIRPFQIEDSHPLCDMLMAEELSKDQMDFLDNETWVYEDGEVKGFYTWYLDNKIPHLIHFTIGRAYRSYGMARHLIQDFLHRMNANGHAKVIIHSADGYIDKLIQFYFKTKPYATEKGYTFYFVEAK